MTLFQRAPAPILAPQPDVPWASGAVFNPGASLDPDGTLRLVARGVPAGYRPAAVESPDATEGDMLYADYVSHLGLAVRQPDGAFLLDGEPLLSPHAGYNRFGVEDARVTRLDDCIYLTYTVLSEPAHCADRGVGIGLASTTDWRHVERHGRIGPAVRDKDAALFPRLVGGRIAMCHRVVPDIQVAFFEDEAQLRQPGAAYWERHLAHLDEHVLMRPEAPWEGKKIGIGPPPIWTDAGWLVVYHGADADHVYRAGLALLDEDLRVMARTQHPVLEPMHDWERKGDVPNVVFPQGAVVEDGVLRLFYGAADTRVGEAWAPLSDVLAVLEDEKKRWRVPPVSLDFRGDRDEARDLGAASAVPVERLHGGRPVLEPVAEHAWESRVVLNPAAVLVDDTDELAALSRAWGLTDGERRQLEEAGGACVMLYRAQGTAYRSETPHGPHVASALGLAVFTPDLRLVRRSPEPVIAPEAPFHDLGVEDPRCTRVGDTYYLHYTGYTSASRTNPSFAGRVHLCLATTQDFVTWSLHGPVEGDPGSGPGQAVNAHDDKNGALFPEPVDGRWFLWHRPVYGRHPMSMHLAEADAPEGPWRSRGRALASYRFDGYAHSWVGAAGPPVQSATGSFWRSTTRATSRSRAAGSTTFRPRSWPRPRPSPSSPASSPVLLPEGDAERVGDPDLGVDDVVFSCAGYVVDGDLVVPYAGADSRVFGARLPLAPLVERLRQRAESRAIPA